MKELETAITQFIEAHNADPTPFQWTKSADEILKNLQRFASDTIKTYTRTQ